MPWLFVEGTGSWGVTLGRTWQEPANELAQGRWVYDTRSYKARGGPEGDGLYHVEQDVRDKAEEEGFPAFVYFFDDEDKPEVDVPSDSGTLSIEDVRSGVQRGPRLRLIDGGGEPEPVDEAEATWEHACRSCPRSFPSPAALERHVEFEHTHRHEVMRKRAEREAERESEEKEELRRLAEAEGKLPPWEREAREPQS